MVHEYDPEAPYEAAECRQGKLALIQPGIMHLTVEEMT